MSKGGLIVLACGAALAVGIGAAAAQGSWCLRVSNGSGGCGYSSFEQCQASRAGGSSHCVPNPAYAGNRPSIDGSAPRGERRR
jgi:Protein of unknown function (DUF3551)